MPRLRVRAHALIERLAVETRDLPAGMSVTLDEVHALVREWFDWGDVLIERAINEAECLGLATLTTYCGEIRPGIECENEETAA